MTNFEKWKKNLKPEDLYVYDEIMNWTSAKLDCEHNCPARDCCPYATRLRECKRNEIGVIWMSEEERESNHKLAAKCKNWFTEWANSTAEEENDA